MHPVRKKRLIIILSILSAAALVIGLFLFALSQNINLFYTPTQLQSEQINPNHTIRVGGLVKDKSLDYLNNDRKKPTIAFIISDKSHSVNVEYTGIIPDLFREGQGVVAIGKYVNNKVYADEILAKHDENYMSKEVKDALEDQGYWQHQDKNSNYGN